MRVQYETRSSQPSRPRVMGSRSRGRSPSVDRGCAGRVCSRETVGCGSRLSSHWEEGHIDGTDIDKGSGETTAVLELGMCRRSMCGNREGLSAGHSGWQSGPWSEPARGTTPMYGLRQSDSFIVPEKTTNKGQLALGVVGGKEADREEFVDASHVPNAESEDT
jgi:hypothetical protein